MTTLTTTQRYAKVIEVSKRVRWEIERDLIRGRRFDYTKSFMPNSLSLVNELPFLDAADKRLLSQVQGRTYAYVFGLVERFIGAKVLEISREHWLGDQVALEALVRMTDEELKHQELFRRLEQMMAADMPHGYVQTAEANAVAQAVLGKSSWSVLALTLDIELFTQAHYRASIEPQDNLSELWKDVFLFHWKEESQHAQLDELDDRAGGRRGRHPAVAGQRGLGLLHRRVWHVLYSGAARPDPRQGPQGLPLAIHRVRRDGAAVPESAVRPARRDAGDACEERPGAPDVRRARATRSNHAARGVIPGGRSRPRFYPEEIPMSDSIRSRLPMPLRSVLRELADSWRYAAARREFNSLDDATLRDLGMRRSEYDSYWAETHGMAERTRKHAMAPHREKQWP
ncbi:MAG: hypothetical protein K0Q43_5761 [Ramlibacter sp.]|nr:hypothetical protein [Ramlibacter sp.]